MAELTREQRYSGIIRCSPPESCSIYGSSGARAHTAATGPDVSGLGTRSSPQGGTQRGIVPIALPIALTRHDPNCFEAARLQPCQSAAMPRSFLPWSLDRRPDELHLTSSIV